MIYILSVTCWDYPNTQPTGKPIGRGCPMKITDATLCAIVWRDRFCRNDPWEVCFLD